MKRKLGESFLLKAGKSIKAKDISENTSLFPCYGGNGLRGYTDTYTHDGEYNLIGRQGALCGNVQLVSGKFYATEHAVVVTPLIDCNSKWLYYALTGMNLNQYSTGAAQPGLSVENLNKLELDIPNIAQQARIADTLDRVKNVIECRKRELQKLDELVKARFVELFGDLASPDCKWNAIKLVDACANPDDIKCGPFGTQLNKDEYTDSGVAVWEIPQINSAFKTAPTHFLTEEKAEQLSAYSLVPGDIAMSRKGNVGKCALFPYGYADGIIHSDVLRIRVEQENVNPVFMMCQLHFSGAVTRQIELVSSGAIMAGVNVTKLKQIFVHIPPKDLQDQFAAFAKQVDKSKVVVQGALDKAQLLFDSMMQECFG